MSRDVAQRLQLALHHQGPLPAELEGDALYREVVKASGADYAAAAKALRALGVDEVAVLGPPPFTAAQQRVAAWRALQPQSPWTVGVALAFAVGLLLGAVLGLVRLVP